MEFIIAYKHSKVLFIHTDIHLFVLFSTRLFKLNAFLRYITKLLIQGLWKNYFPVPVSVIWLFNVQIFLLI